MGGAIIIPFVILWLQHRWDSDKKEIALSNLVTSEQLKELELKLAPLLKELEKKEKINPSSSESDINLREQQILKFLAIFMGANAGQIAMYMGLSRNATRLLLKKMVNEGKIQASGTSHGIIYKTVSSLDAFGNRENDDSSQGESV